MAGKTKRLGWALIAAVCTTSAAAPPAGGADPAAMADGARPAEPEMISNLGQGLFDAARRAAEGDTLAALLSLGEQATRYALPAVGTDLPEWARHVEADWQVNENNAPSYSVLGVVPLFETDDLTHTVFTQLSQQRYRYLGVDRDVTNVGLGYRRLLLDNTMLVGVNGFFDYGWEYHHQRVSAGAELKWGGLDLNSNFYWKASSSHATGDDGTYEEVLDGHDIRLAAQVPHIPWARVHARRYWWSTSENDEDIKGWEAGLEMDLHQNFRLEAGVSSDNYIDDANNNEGYVKLTFTMDLGRPAAFSSKPISKDFWTMRDMTKYRLDKVERENKIIVERVSSGVVITRGT